MAYASLLHYFDGQGRDVDGVHVFSCLLQGKAVATASGAYVQYPSRGQLQSRLLQVGHGGLAAKQFFHGDFVFIELR